jgi:hypothetical protein
MGTFLHPMCRIAMLIRGNLTQVRQVESGTRPDHGESGRSNRAAKRDLMFAQITAQFAQFDVEKSRGGYLVFNRGGSDPVAVPFWILIASNCFIGPTFTVVGAPSAISAA